MTDIGYIALLLAFFVAVYSAAASIVGARREDDRLISSARNGIYAVGILFTLGVAAMIYALVTDDFSVRLVYEHSATDLPRLYTLASLYADKAGSLLFWGWLLSVFGAIMTFRKFEHHRKLMPYALCALAVILAFFLGLVTFVENVFQDNPLPATDGFGLNPLLQNIGMLIHPPLLFIGYAGFAVLFVFALGSLLARDPDKVWIPSIRRWALFAWCTLGLGNLVGAWWAYIELGWGGYWAWDPVENAGIMPWFLGTAALHTMALQRKTGRMKMWTALLIAFTFAFTLLSPYITHGGIDSPLHGFGGTPFVPYLLGAIIAIAVVSLIAVATRRADLRDEQRSSALISRESAFLVTGILFVLLVFLVLLGTVLPRLAEALGTTIALERDFFDLSAGPVLLVIVFFLGICPLLSWRRTSRSTLRRNFLIPFLAAAAAAIIIMILGIGNWYAVAALVGGFPLMTIFVEWVRGTRARHRSKGENYPLAFLSLVGGNRPRYGGYLVHIGIALIAIGILGSSLYDIEETATLTRGESLEVGDYTLRLDDLDWREEDTKVVSYATVAVFRGDSRITTMYPENNYWYRHQNNFAEASVRTTLADDVFVVMSGYDHSAGTVSLRALVNPLVVWLWIGGGFLILGGLVAFLPERQRGKAQAPSAGD
jgi:cytochrome c-type biogenesis protein CcmF